MVLSGLHYSDPKGIAKWTKSITDEYLNSILLAKYGCKTHRKWRTGKRQPNRAIQTQFRFHRSWILHFKKRLAKYSMKTMAAGIKDDQSV
jgi:hypothetical protein